MNTHKKLLNMGFIKCYPHVKYRNSYDEPCKMVPDVYTNEIKVIDGKRTMVKTKKLHNKWKIFYKMIFTEGVNIWIETNKGQIKKILLEGIIAKDGVEMIYEYNKIDSILLESKKDIIKLFPKAIQRDFIINDLFR